MSHLIQNKQGLLHIYPNKMILKKDSTRSSIFLPFSLKNITTIHSDKKQLFIGFKGGY